MSLATVLEPTTKPAKSRKPSGDQSPRKPVERLPKSKDDSLVKASFYLPRETAQKLLVGAMLRGVDQSDLVAMILGRELSGVAFYEKASHSTRPTDSTLTVSESAETVAAE